MLEGFSKWLLVRTVALNCLLQFYPMLVGAVVGVFSCVHVDDMGTQEAWLEDHLLMNATRIDAMKEGGGTDALWAASRTGYWVRDAGQQCFRG